MEELQKITCILCHQVMLFPELPATKYIHHLMNTHDIMFDLEPIINRTLLQQFPHLAQKEECSCQYTRPKNTDVETQTEKCQPKIKTEICDQSSNYWKEEPPPLPNGSRKRNLFEDCGPFYNNPSVKNASNTNSGVRISRISSGSNSTEDSALGTEDNFELDHGSKRVKLDAGATLGLKIHSTAGAQSFLQKAATVDTDWAIGCSFRCQVCNVKFQTKQTFLSHLPSSHPGPHLEMEDYRALYGDPEVMVQHHNCRKCDQPVQQDPLLLAEHMERQHRISLEEYTRVYYVQANQNDDGDESNLEFEDSSSFLLSEFLEDSTTSPVKDCSVQLKNILPNWQEVQEKTEILIEGAKLELGGETEELYDIEHSVFGADGELDTTGKIPWYHGCIYSCKVGQCQRQFFDRTYLKLHIEMNHNLDFDLYLKEHEESQRVTHYHECEICGKGLVHMKTALESHIVKQHNMSLEQYYVEFSQVIELPQLRITDQTLLSTVNPEKSVVKLRANSEGGFERRESDWGWANRCVFLCVMCQPPLQLDSRAKMEGHVRAEHKIKMGEYTKLYGRTMIHIEKHICQICGSKVMWDRNAIYSHLREVHNKMSVEEYDNDFMDEYNEEKFEKFDVKKKGKSNTGKQFDSWEDRSWTSECTYQCKIEEPPKLFNSWCNVNNHMKAQHGLLLKEYRQKYGNSLIKKVNHTCQVCGSSFLWERHCIYQHIQKHDKMTLDQYYQEYMENYEEEDVDWLNKCTFSCKACNGEFETNMRSKIRRHLLEAHEMNQILYKNRFGTMMKTNVNHTCQICAKKLMWESFSLKPHLEKVHKILVESYFEKYMHSYEEAKEVPEDPKKENYSFYSNCSNNAHNKCLYECQICFATCQSDQKFKEHLKASHQILKSEHSANFGSCILKKVIHECQLCGKEMFYDKYKLAAHAKESHQMTGEEYIMDNIDTLTPLIPDHIPEDEVWMSKCLFSCKLCKMSFRQKSKLEKHIVAAHDALLSEHKKLSGRCHFVIKEFHKCLICKKDVVFDKSHLQNHLNIHDITTTAYKAQYVDNENHLKDENEWMDKTKYQCIISTCILKFNNRSLLTQHLTQIHNFTEEEYTKRHGSTICKSLLHTCQVCQENIVWDSFSLLPHFESHGLNSADYHKKFMSSYKQNEEASKQYVSDTNWVNKNDYVCRLQGCGYKCAGRLKLVYHLKKVHADQLTVNQYFKANKDSLLTQKYHVCQICGKSVLWDYTYLQRHISIHHKTKLSSYYERHMENYTETPKMDRKNAKARKKLLVTATQSTFNDINMEGMPQQGIIEENEEVGRWLAGSLYLCHHCNKSIAGLDHFSKHLYRIHDTPYYKYAKNYKDFRLISGFHFCKICHKNIKWDREPLTKHLEEDHKISAHEYFYKYKPKMPRLTESVFQSKDCGNPGETGNEQGREEGIEVFMEETNNVDNMENASESIADDVLSVLSMED